MTPDRLLAHYDRIADAPDAIGRLRRFVLTLAVRGKLVTKANGETLDRRLRSTRGEKHPELPQHWAFIPLEQVLAGETRNGYARRPDDAEDGVPILRISAGTIRTDGIVSEEEHKLISGITPDVRAQYSLQQGDLLACRFNGNKAYVGRLSLFEDYLKLKPIYPDKLIRIRVAPDVAVAKFIRMAGDTDIVRSAVEACCATTVGNWGISASNLRTIHFPIPPLAEQHRIVAKVDELMALCDRLEVGRVAREAARDRLAAASLARLNTPDPDPASFTTHARFALNALPALSTRADQIKALRQTILNLAVRGKLVLQEPADEPAAKLLSQVRHLKQQEMKSADGRKQSTPLSTMAIEAPYELPPGWQWVRVDDCFTVTGGIQKTPARTPLQNAFPYLGVGNVYRNRLELSELRQFELYDGELERYRLRKADILIVEGNGSATEIGRCAVWNDEIADCVHQNHIIRCRPIDRRVTPFVSAYLNAPDGITIMTSLAITSSGLYSLSVGKVRNIAIPVPPLREQHRIVAKVDALMALCDRLEAAITTGDETRRRLLDALLQEALASPGTGLDSAA